MRAGAWGRARGAYEEARRGERQGRRWGAAGCTATWHRQVCWAGCGSCALGMRVRRLVRRLRQHGGEHGGKPLEEEEGSAPTALTAL